MTELLFVKIGVGKIDPIPISEYKRCHFCDRFVLPIGVEVWHIETTDVEEEFKKLLGEVPKLAAGNIGKKIICVDCSADLWNVLGLNKYDLELYYD